MALRFVARLIRWFGGSRWELLLDFDLGPGEDFEVGLCDVACNEDFFGIEEADVADDLVDGLATLFVGTATVIFLRVVLGFALPNMAVICLCPDLKLERMNEDYHGKDRIRV